MDSSATVQEIMRTYYGVLDAKTGNPAALDSVLAATWKTGPVPCAS